MRKNAETWGILVMILLLFVFSARSFNESRIIEKPSNQFYPAIYKNIVVWEDDRNGGLDVYGYNIEEEQRIQIAANDGSQLFPAIYENIVIWMDFRNGNWDIYGYDLSTKREFPITTNKSDQQSPVIYGDIVVWEDNRNGMWDIYGYDLSTNKEFPITTSPSDERSPSIHKGIVVWEDNRNGNWDIYGYNILTSQKFQITVELHNQRFPAIYENLVIWMDFRNGNWDIYGHDLSEKEELSIITNENDQRSPVIYGNYVIWYDDRNCRDKNNGNWDIYGYDIFEKEEFSIITNENDQRSPAIYKDVIVWMDFRNGNWDIYGYNFSTNQEFLEAASEPMLSFPYADQRSYYLVYAVIPLIAITIILVVYRIAERCPKITFEREFIEPPREKMKKLGTYRVNALKDPLSNFIIGRWKGFLIIFLSFVFLLFIMSFFYGNLIEIDINSLSREKTVFLYEEAFSHPVLKDPDFILICLMPIIIFFTARRFFLCIPYVFETLFRSGLIRRKKGSTRKALNDFNETLKRFESRINGKCIYIPAFCFFLFGILVYFREFLRGVKYKSPEFVVWGQLHFFPANWIVDLVLVLLLFFMFGIIIWKVFCVVSFVRQLNNQYDLILKPYDTDGLGGFSPLEYLLLNMTLIVVPLLLAIIIYFVSNRLFGTVFEPLGNLLLSNIVVVSLLTYPILYYHYIVKTQKNNLLDDIERKIDIYYRRIEEALLDEEKDLEKHFTDQIEHLQKIVLKTKSIPSWPFTTYQKTGIFLSAVVPWIVGIIDYISKMF